MFEIFLILRLRLRPTAEGRSLSGPNIRLRPKVKIRPTVQHWCTYIRLFLADPFSDSLHKPFLDKTTLKLGNRNWGYLLKSRLTCTTFSPKKGFLVINLLYLKCTVCKKLRFSFFLIQTMFSSS